MSHPPCTPNRLRQLWLATLLPLCLAGTQAMAADGDFRYVVKPGDNPWNITARYLRHIDYWPRIQSYNDIVAPTAIPPGTVLRIPVAWMRADSISANVVDLRGEVIAERAGERIRLEPGMAVRPGSVIRSGAESSFKLRYPDGSETLVGENAELRLKNVRKLRAGNAQQVDLELRGGELHNRVETAPNAGGRFVIQTPAAVAAVRGTDFRAAATPTTTRVETLSGEVRLRNARGEVRLAAGAGSLAGLGDRPEKAAALLPAPDLGGLARIERLPIEESIAPVEGASAYRTQVAPLEGFNVLLSDRTSPRAALTARGELPDGRDRVKVRAVDARGIEGLDAEAEVEIDARPEPPFVITPAPDGVASDERSHFGWAEVPGALHYHFELAADSGFSEVLARHDALTSATHTLDEALPQGVYFWRVAVTTPDEGRGPYSDAHRFRRLEAGPEPESAEVVSGELALRWRATPAATAYRVQIASTADFAQPLHEIDTNEPGITIEAPPAGQYFVRVRHVEADGATGPWGRPQTLEVPHNYWPALLILAPLLFL